MFDGTLKFDTAIDKTGFKLGLGSLGSIAKAGMTAVTAAVGAASGAVAALGGYAVSVGKGFEASMAQVSATLGLSVDDIANNAEVTIGGTVMRAGDAIDKLTAKAEEMGAKTSFSASQAAEGLNILAMSGYDVEKSISIINSTLDLAAAGGIALADSASYITGSMKGFASEASNFANETESSAYYSDLMAKGATLAATDVNNLGLAMSDAAAIADSYKQNSTETAVALLRLAEQGEVGSAAATALSAAMKDIYSPTDTAKKVLCSLGVSAYTASGEARAFNEVVDELNQSLSNLSAEERAGMEDAIFGIQGKAAFDKMIVSAEDKVQNFYEGLSEASGSASTQAATMLDNLEGDLTIMNSAAEGFGISIYKALNNPLRDIVQEGTGYIGQLTNAFKDEGFNGLASSLGDVLGQAVTQLSSYVPGLVDMGVSLVQSLVQGISENSGQISESLVSALQSLVIGGFEITKDMVKLGCELILQLAHGFAEALPDILAEAVSLAEAVVNSVSEALPEFLSVLSESAPMIFEAGMSVLGELMRGLTENLPIIIETAIKILSSLAKSVSENLPLFLTAALELLTALAASIIENLPMLLEAAIGIITSLVTWISENIGLLIDAAVNILMMLVDFIIDNLPMLIDACLEIITQLVKGLFQYMPKIMETGIKILLKLIEGLINAIPQLFKAVPKIISAIWDAVTETDWLSLGKNILLGIADGLSKGLSAIWGAITDVCESIWNKFTDFFGIHSPSTLFRDELGKFMLPGMVIGVESTENTAASGINSSLEKVEKQIKPIQLPKPETPDIDTKIVKYEVPQLEVEFAEPEIPPIDVEFNKPEIPPVDVELAEPEIPPIETDIPKAEIKSETVYIFDKDGIDEKDDFPKRYTPKAEYDAVEEIKVIRFDNDSLKALESARLTMNTGFSQPSPMSEITNNYNYSTVNKGADTTASQNITIPVSLVMDGQIIAEGLADIVLDEVDKQQGVTVQMKKRGIAQ